MKTFIKAAAAVMFAGMLLCPVQTVAKLTAEQAVFQKSNTYYRIPAIASNGNGTVIAFCDDRGATGSDLGGGQEIRIMYKIGTLSADRTTVSWGDAAYLCPEGTEWHGDPAVVFEPKTQRFVVLMIAGSSWTTNNYRGLTRVYRVVSTDATGTAWSAPEDITAQFLGSNQRGFMSSGSMIADADGNIYGVFCKGTSGDQRITNYVYRSSDLGLTWQAVSNGLSYGDESKITFVNADKKVVLSQRAGPGTILSTRRFYQATPDASGYYDFGSRSNTISTLSEGKCNGAIIATTYNGQQYLLQSYCYNRSDNDLRVSYSTNGGNSWTASKTDDFNYVYKGEYSDLIDLGNGVIGMLYERKDPFAVYFRTFTVGDVLGQSFVISDEFDGTLKCKSKGYLELSDKVQFAVSNGQSVTITGRIRSTGNDNPGGILGTRYKSNYNKFWDTYRNVEGFELYAGQDGRAGYNAFGANVSVPQKKENMLNVLGNRPYPFRNKLGDWVHFALVIDFGAGKSVRTYINGNLYEKQGIGEDGLSGTVVGYDEGGNAIKLDNISNGVGTQLSGLSSLSMGVMDKVLIGRRYHNDTGIIITSINSKLGDIFDGAIDDIRVYNSVLSDEEIAKDAWWGFPLRQKDGLRVAYDFANYTGDTYTDISGKSLVAVAKTNDYSFPLEQKVTIQPLEPTRDGGELMGTMTVTFFKDGLEQVLNGTVAAPVYNTVSSAIGGHNVTLNTDFKVVAAAKEGYELVGIYVNGQELPLVQFTEAGYVAGTGNFFKASKVGANQVQAVFRSVMENKEFYLVGDFSKGQRLPKYKFTYVPGDDETEGSETVIGPFDNDNMAGGKRLGYYHLKLTTENNDKFKFDWTYTDQKENKDVTVTCYGLYGNYHIESADAVSVVARAATPDYHLYAHQSELTQAGTSKIKQEVNRRYALSLQQEDNISAENHFNPSAGIGENPLTGLDKNGTHLSNPHFELIYRPDTKTLALRGKNSITGVDDITAGEATDAPVEYYNLQGIRTASSDLTPGIYLKRQGNTVTKVIVK